MLIARTQEESDLFCEQELSHVIRFDQKTPILSLEGISYIVDNNNQKLVFIPRPTRQKTIRTRKYGTLVLYDRIKDFIDSKFNKCCIPVYCGSVSSIKRKRTTNVLVGLATIDEALLFEDKEFSNSGGVYLNNVDDIEPMEAYLLVVDRNRFSQNGCIIVETFKLKKNG